MGKHRREKEVDKDGARIDKTKLFIVKRYSVIYRLSGYCTTSNQILIPAGEGQAGVQALLVSNARTKHRAVCCEVLT